MAAALRPAATRPCRSQVVLPTSSRGAVLVRAAADPQEPQVLCGGAAPPNHPRRSVLLLAGPLLAALAARPAAAALDAPPSTAPYGLKLPASWISAETTAPGAGMGVQASPGGGRRTQAWFPPEGPDAVSISLLTTPIGADFTALGSFGDAGTFGANLVASSDQSFRARGPRGLPVRDVQTASLIDARPATAPNGAPVYRIDYKLKRAGEEAPRTFYTAVALGPDPSGRYNTLVTLTATATAAALEGVEADLVAAVDSFCPPVGKGGMTAMTGHAAAAQAWSFVDIGANLTDPMFAGTYHGRPDPYHPPDLTAVLDRAWGAGVTKIIITATNLEEGRAALALARTDARLFCTAGVHPTRAGELVGGGEAYLRELKALIAEGVAAGKCVAVGEAGLDNDRLQFCDADTQAKGLAVQLDLAAQVGLPLFLHCRAAAPALAAALAAGPPLPRGGVVHSFDGTLDEMRAFLAMSLPGKLFIGLNGCSLKTAENLRTAAAVPLDRLLLETDAPWCEPRPSHASASYLQGAPPNAGAVDKKKWVDGRPVKGRNEPAAIVAVATVVAGVRGEEVAALAAATTANADELFGFGGA